MANNSLKRFSIQITHLSNNNIVDKTTKTNSIENLDKKCEEKQKELIKKLKENIYNIESIELKKFTFNNKTNIKNLREYEDNNVFRFSGFITCISHDIKLIKKVLVDICKLNVFENTLFSLDLKTLRYLSQISTGYTLIPHQTFKGIKSFAFGTLIDLTNFIEHFKSDANEHKLNVAKDDIIADFEHDRKRLILKYRLTSGGLNGKHTKNIRYKLEYKYSSINSVICCVDNKIMRIYVTLNHPPILFKCESDDLTAEEKLIRLQTNDRNRRIPPHKQKSYKNIETNEGIHTNEVPNHLYWIRENEFIGCKPETIGKCNVLMLEIPLVINESKVYLKSRELPDPWRLIFVIKRFLKLETYVAFIKDHKPLTDNNGKGLSVEKQLIDNICVNFAVKYAYHSVFSYTFQSSDELFFKKQVKEFKHEIEVLSATESSAKVMAETLFELSALIDRCTTFCTMSALKYIFNDIKQRYKNSDKEIGKSFKTEIEYIRRCIITPSRFLVLPPQPTLKSRFIANSDPDYTIRLSVREDDLQGLQYTMGMHSQKQILFLEKIIKNPLMKGIKIGNRLFEFLGSSSSQLRDTGMILYAKDSEGRTTDSIREDIGDMSEIRKNPAKYVARLGLAFSQVMTHIEVKKCFTRVEEDIEGGFKPLNEDYKELSKKRYVFSDGIGRVSKEIMERVYKSLENECKHKPSAMQIRYGGCKGMLVIDPSLEGQQIIFRKSMEKYRSKEEMLGIIKLSAPRPLFLNRPLITILDQLDVECKQFQKMLFENLKSLLKAMICECSATPLLQNSSTLSIPYRKLLKSGVPFLSEPIFRQIIDCVVNHRMNELKSKARIKLPMNCGRTVFGVLDETNSLDYGEVFIQISVVDEDLMPIGETILKGEVMVTKFPCLHPGDVRKLNAVDIKALHHIKDCIVFPAKGKRPHPDEMAGSDLDGDEYAVIWGSPLIFNGENKPAMIFPTSQENLLKNDADVGDILDFYCKYILRNNVGLLASAHLANSDHSKEGIFSDVCMSLARKYAIALDFAKTGTIENMEWRERPQLYPDFMEKFAQKRTYLSNKVLGQLFRQCDRYALGLMSNRNLEIKAVPNPLFRKKGYEKFSPSAIEAYRTYKAKVSFLLNRFGVESEAALLSGAFSKSSKYMTGRTETNDVHHLLENMINKLFIEFKERFDNESKDDNEVERSQRVSAWYLVPFEIKDEFNDRFFGFSWTIPEEMCRLMKSCPNSSVLKEDHNCFQSATDLIDNFFADNYIYREPNIDESIRDEKMRRQTIMEARCKSAEVVLGAWLERQDHLFFKRQVAKKLCSSTDWVMSDMNRKLRRKLLKMRIDLLFEVRDNLDKPLITAGSIVMNFLKDSFEEWLNISTIDQNNRIVDTPLVKLGFSSLLTLNHFFRTREISHIISISPRFQVSLRAPIRDSTFYIALPYGDRYKQFVESLVQYPELFIQKLKSISGAIEIYLEPYPLNTQRLSHFYLLTATGTVWSLQTIKNFISHPSFFNSVATGKWKKKNLFCKGMPDWRSPQSIGLTIDSIKSDNKNEINLMKN